MANENHWCFAWMHQKAKDEATKAALVKAAKWNAGGSITVSFLDGVPSGFCLAFGANEKNRE